MKRDMDLVRELLSRLEEMHIPAGGVVAVSLDDPVLAVEGKSVDEIAYALRMIQDAGFLDLTRSQPMDGVCMLGLSWNGHDFLDSVRDPKIWHATKEGAKKAGGFTADLLVDLAKGLIKTALAIHTGVQL